MRALALLLACAALPALAQEAKEAKPAPQPQERRPLNLKLDNPSSWATETRPAAKEEPRGALPTLGEDARSMPTEVPRSDTRSPFPKDTAPGSR